MSEKVIGYVLLGIGIVMVLISAFSVYMVLTAQANPAAFIQQQGPVTLDLALPLEGLGQTVEIPVAIDKLVPIHRLINTGVHVMLMGFMASIGTKLASIGTSLVRPIVVKTKESA